MSNAPVYHIDVDAFWHDPYPDLRAMRRDGPIVYVPELAATLLTTRADIAVNEKRVDIFSSEQPDGLMTRLMGENLMRKDGRAHMAERKAIHPTMSPKTVRTVWASQFAAHARRALSGLSERSAADLFQAYALPVSANALRCLTGLTNMTPADMDRVSQGMIAGCANYTDDPAVTAHCHACTALIDRCIDERLPEITQQPDQSLLAVQLQAGMSELQIRANVKLAISGGQNEPRDAIAGTAWALLTHPQQLQLVLDGGVSWLQAFEEYARWISPIGMSPRRVAAHYDYNGVHFDPEDRVFLMFGSANRDETVFDHADAFDITRDLSASVSFGAGPHFCAGAWASRSLIADIALPLLFKQLQALRVAGAVPFGGWAFRGPLALPCSWDASG